jgi:hypothetical protein
MNTPLPDRVMVAASTEIGPPVASTPPPENAAQVPPVRMPDEAFSLVTPEPMTIEPPLTACTVPRLLSEPLVMDNCPPALPCSTPPAWFSMLAPSVPVVDIAIVSGVLRSALMMPLLIRLKLLDMPNWPAPWMVLFRLVSTSAPLLAWPEIRLLLLLLSDSVPPPVRVVPSAIRRSVVLPAELCWN